MPFISKSSSVSYSGGVNSLFEDYKSEFSVSPLDETDNIFLDNWESTFKAYSSSYPLLWIGASSIGSYYISRSLFMFDILIWSWGPSFSVGF